MSSLVKERNGGRRFERISRWNNLDYTIIADNNRFAKYADNAGTGKKLTLTYFRWKNQRYPFNMFGKLIKPMVLEDFSTISRQSVEDCKVFLEVNATKDKVRLYREV